jgi:hypothetical protein
VAAIEQSEKMQQQAVGNWTLWQVSDEANAGYPQALSAYSSKNECLASTARWSFPGGKLVSSDPAIFQMKGYRVRLECLPAGTNPYAR